MSVRISTDEGVAALFDSVTGWAFGPTFASSDEADDFLVYLESAGHGDPRAMTEADLKAAHEKWAAEQGQPS